MKHNFVLAMLCLFSSICTNLFAQSEKLSIPTFATTSTAAFIENKGQVHDMNGNPCPNVKFIFKCNSVTVYLTNTGLVYQFFRKKEANSNPKLAALRTIYRNTQAIKEFINSQKNAAKALEYEAYRMNMELVGANPNARITAEYKSPDCINYYTHDVLNVHSYQQIIYHDIYPHIDWVIYTTDKGIKYDFILKPTANPAQIQLKFDHHEQIELRKDGSLRVANRLGEIVEQMPISTQNNQYITTQFALKDSIIQFEIAEYNKLDTLILDPSVEWATYFGSTLEDYFTDCVLDNEGNLYASGANDGNWTVTNLVLNGHQTINLYLIDAILVKYNSQGVRQWATFYGGFNYEDSVSYCMVDKQNNVYLAGMTYSSNGIGYHGMQDTMQAAAYFVPFLVKFNEQGIRQWGTYIGGGISFLTDCEVDSLGNTFLVGVTLEGHTIPMINAYQSFSYSNRHGGFVISLDSLGSVRWSTAVSLGYCYDIRSKIDGAGNLYTAWYIDILGNAFTDVYMTKLNNIGGLQWNRNIISLNSPTPYLPAFGWSTYFNHDLLFNKYSNTIYYMLDSMLYKLDTTGQIIRSQRILPSNIFSQSTITKINADKWDNLYLIGSTSATNGIADNGVRNTYMGGSSDAFITMLDSSGAMRWGTYWGGSSQDNGWSCAIDASGDIYLAGRTYSIDSMAYHAEQPFLSTHVMIPVPLGEGFIVKMDKCSSLVANVYQSICQSDSFIFNNQLLTAAGIYRDTLMNAIGCDSIVILHLSINRPVTSSLQQTICQGRSYYFNNQWLTTAGLYRDTLINSMGCDSVIVLQLMIQSAPINNLQQIICQGNTYYFNGQYLSQTGIYYDTLTNVIGCDSIIALQLLVNARSNSSIIRTLNAGTSYYFNGQYLTNAGIYYDTLTNAAGCDSLITLNLLAPNQTSTTIYQAICQGSRYYFNGQYLTNAGVYQDTFITARGSDSIVILQLIIKTTSTATIQREICQGGRYYFNGQYLTNAGIYRDTLLNSQGCDSILNLNLSIKQPQYATIYDTICPTGSYYFNNQILTQQGIYFDTLQSYTTGCDSVITLYLSVNINANNVIFDTICISEDFYFNGRTLSATGIYYDTIATSSGCDSLITLFLTVRGNHSASALSATVCDGQTFYFAGQYLTQTGIYYDTLTNTQGCDSVITCSLQVNHSYDTIIYAYICAGESYLYNGISYSQSGIYTFYYQTDLGCDSTVRLMLQKTTPIIQIYQQLDTLIALGNMNQYQWISCVTNQPIANATDAMYIVPTSGQFAVVGTLNNCVDTSICVDIIATATNPITADSTNRPIYWVYPNPSNGFIMLGAGIPLKNVKVYVYDVLGRLMREFFVPDGNIYAVDMRDLAAASYILVIKGEEATQHIKVIKVEE